MPLVKPASLTSNRQARCADKKRANQANPAYRGDRDQGPAHLA